ncbi:prolyl oligopeptidase family serine peptidase [Povalibacter sp.]|uniref:prolyl oligopeptidase family serine peptidase n=1 Tax=Povalibacter sp. TaxID=1962978 RepID=UPI002F4222D6
MSPDGQRYAILLVTGDIARDGVWLQLLAGTRASLAQARPRPLVRLFTRGLGVGYARRFGSDQLTTAGNIPVWLDNQTIGFFWEDEAGVRQVMQVNVDDGHASPLTRSHTPVIRFAAASGALLYSAAVPRDAGRGEVRQREGFAVNDKDVLELLNGGVRGAWDWMMHDRFLITPSHPMPRRVAFVGGEIVSRYLPLVAPVYSPDTRSIATPHTVSDQQITAEWVRYTQPHFRDMWTSRQSDPESFYARQFQKFFVIDAATATARPLWDAPVDGLGRTRMAWAPNGRHLVLGPTFLPLVQADVSGLAGDAVAVVDVATGRFERLPLPDEAARQLRELTWTAPNQIEAVLVGGERMVWRRSGRGWKLDAATKSPPDEASEILHIEIRQGLNQPPRLVGRDRTGEAVLFDPNPQLNEARLGRVEWIRTKTGDGRAWEGRLYYPLNYRPGQRYPLVVQTYGFTPREEFSIYGHAGPPLGPGRSAYIAQALAGRDIFVLHGPSRGEAIEDISQVLDDLEEQIEHLVASGMVERAAVGIMGFSASGWITTYALTRGGFTYAAALTDDNKDGSYLQAAMSNWDFASGQEMIGAPPFGEGLKRWLEHSPAMNTERIHAPLLITRSSPGLPLNGWELFSRLRYLRKPVEYYFVPDVEHGSHGLQNPRQLRALQERALDWWCFWLKKERDSHPMKQAQYAMWERLRILHDKHVTSSLLRADPR